MSLRSDTWNDHAAVNQSLAIADNARIRTLEKELAAARSDADTYALLLRKLTKDDTLLAAYRRSKNLDHRGVPVVSDVVLEMLRKEEAVLGRAGT